MTQLKRLLTKALKENDFALQESMQDQLLQYLELLKKWNKVFNLTAIFNDEDMVLLHIIDSLTISPFLNGDNIVDVGTGAGLPGIPLAIIHPDKHFVLVDSNSKKTRFLTQVKLELKLLNVDVIHGRCEDVKTETKFDSVLSRAFTSLSSMLEKTNNLASEQGVFLAMKGVYPEEEIKEIPGNFIVQAVNALLIKGLQVNRHVVCIKRI